MSDELTLLKDLTLRLPKDADRIPVWDPDDPEGAALTPALLLGHGVIAALRDPGASDDNTQGHWLGRLWANIDDPDDVTLWICTGNDTDAGAWRNLLANLDITGLTNPLVAGLNAAGNLIYGAAFAGFRDRLYNLETDSSSYVSSGVAQLTHVYNAYYHPDVDAALEIRLPDPASVPSSDALFGMINVRLGSGGSVALGQEHPWTWERSSPSDATPALPTDAGSHFHLRYAYDPIAEAYAVSLAHMDASTPTSTAATYVDGSVSVSNLSLANKDTHVHTHPITSTSQAGTLYAIVGFFGDGTPAPTSVPARLTAINAPPVGAGTQVQGWWYRTQITDDDITAGEIEFSFTKANEMAQIVVFEAAGAHTSAPVGGLAFDRSSSTSRTAIGPTALTAPVDGCLMVCSVSMDMSSGVKPTIAVNVPNGFTEIASFISETDGCPTIRVLIAEAELQDEYDTPSFTRSSTGSASVQLEAFSLVPNA